MRKEISHFFLTISIVIFSSTAHADLLGSGSISTNNGSGGIFNSYGLLFHQGTGIIIPSEDYIPLPSGVGTTIIDDSYGDLFTSASTLLTNGTVDILTPIYTSSNDGFGFLFTNECFVFYGNPDCTAGVDFLGATIDHIEFQTTYWNIQSPGRNLTGDGNWTDYNVEATIRVFGSYVSAPEPTSLVLLGLGLAGLGIIKWSKQS